MLQLNKLTKLTKKRKTVGRGGSRGGTSGRGHKGQNARSGGGVRPGFEGGQMPLTRRIPKRGFNNKRFAKEFVIISLGTLDKKFKEGDIVDREALMKKGIINSRISLIKILGTGKLSKKLSIVADAFSESAKKAVVNIGGKAELTKEI
jgi:large subunit ribosomal protein L15